jgi:hypothetical protein
MRGHAPADASGVFPELLAKSVNLRRLIEFGDVLYDDFKRILILKAVRGLSKGALRVKV